MDSAAFSLDAYLARIGHDGGHDGGRAPTLDVLRALHLAHPRAIAFENLDPLLRRPVPLDVESLQAKLVRGGRGGWCFEHNHLFRAALDALGFRTTPLIARVLWNAAPGATTGAATARSHMLLLVHLDEGTFVADVGFGALTLTAPLRLVPNDVQETPHEPFRLTPLDERDLALEAHVAGAWKPLYRFDLTPQHPPDYELSSWYLCTHPKSSFLSNLMAARAEPGVRHTLRNNVLGTYRAGAAPESRRLESAGALRAALVETFGITPPESPDLEPALERIAAMP